MKPPPREYPPLRPRFEFPNFTNYRIRALLYTGKHSWDLLPSVTPP